MRNSIDQYEVLFWVAKCRSFAEASGLMGCSRTTLLRAIDRLEDKLGFKVLTRHNQGVDLTPAGQRLVDVYRGVRLAMKKVEAPSSTTGVANRQTSIAVTDLALVNDLYTHITQQVSHGGASRTSLTICDLQAAIDLTSTGACDVAFISDLDGCDLDKLIELPLVSKAINLTNSANSVYAIYDRRLAPLGEINGLIEVIKRGPATNN